jgi:lysophospholipase L1-like esterase
MARLSRRRKALFIFAAGAGVIGAALAMTEVGLRIHRGRLIRGDATWNAWTKIYRQAADPILVYEQVPGTAANWQGAPVVINDDGFRDDPFPPATPGGGRRILVLGDSVAWGWGIEMDRAFPQVLERKLRARAAPDEPPPVVLNLAVAGYSTAQELRLLETRVAEFHPDLVILHYVLNDPDTYDGGLSRYFTEPPSELARRFQMLLYRIRRVRSNSERADEAGEDYCHFVHGLNRRGTEQAIRRMGEIRRERGLPILLAVNPPLGFEAGKPYPWRAIHEDLRSWCARYGVEFLDLYEAAFKGLNSADLAFDIWHPRERGHELIAEALDHWLGEHPPAAEASRITKK